MSFCCKSIYLWWVFSNKSTWI